MKKVLKEEKQLRQLRIKTIKEFFLSHKLLDHTPEELNSSELKEGTSHREIARIYWAI